MRKKRVLVVTEATYLCTGYASYGRGLLEELYNSRKYDIAEFSIYGSANDERRKEIKWLNYPNMPNEKNKEEIEIYNSHVINQFGAWRFERVCLDFKPDVVITFSDFWMSDFVQQSPYRRLFSWYYMPTVDGAPQSEEWISCFNSTDGLFTYSDFAFNLLKQQGLGNKLLGVASPVADETYQPVLDKRQHKSSIGLNPDWKIIGTVMRNQRRKLFPDLFEAFGKYLNTTKDPNTYLYCHTSYPDNGWNLPKYLIKNGITSRVIFTYICDCGNIVACKFGDVVQQCPSCGEFKLKMSSVSQGTSVEQLNTIYNVFDLYVQPANSEGFGCPVGEAAACGVPLMVMNYSAMEDFVHKLEAIPIRLAAKYNELETGVYRAVPDIDDFVQKLIDFFSLPEPLRLQKGLKTRKMYEKNYSWKNVAKLWMEAIDKSNYADWFIPPIIRRVPEQIPPMRNNKEFLDWLISFVIDPNLSKSYSHLLLLRDLNFAMFRGGPGGYFYSDNSAWGRENYKELTPQMAYEIIKRRVGKDSFWEQARVGLIQLKKEDWLPITNKSR